jgi:hypothetical protein
VSTRDGEHEWVNATGIEEDVTMPVTTTDIVTPRTQTVLDRLLEAGITRQRALAHLKRGSVQVDGTTVVDPEAPAGLPARIEFRFIPPYDD